MTGGDLHWLNNYRDILRAIKEEGGEVSPLGELAEETDRSRSGVGVALEKLENQDIVHKQKNGGSKKVSIDESSLTHWLNEYQDILRILRSAGGEIDKIDRIREKTERSGGDLTSSLERLEEADILRRQNKLQDGRMKKVVLKGYESSEGGHELNEYQDILRFLSDGDAEHIFDIEKETDGTRRNTRKRLDYLVENNFLEYDDNGDPSHTKLKIREEKTHWLNDDEYRDILRALYDNGGSVEPLDSLRFALDDNPYNGIETRLRVLDKHDYIDWESEGESDRIVLPDYEGEQQQPEKEEDGFIGSYEVKDFGGDEVLWIQSDDGVYVTTRDQEYPETGAVKARESSETPVTGVKGAEVVEYGNSVDELEDSKA